MTAWNRKQFSTHKNNKQLISDKARQMSTNNIINILKAPVIIHRLSGGGKGMEDLVCVTIKLTWSSFKALLYSFDSLSPPPQSIFFRLPLCTLLATTEPPVPPENHVIPAKNPPTSPPPPHQYFVTDTMIPKSSDWMIKLTDYYNENLTDLP